MANIRLGVITFFVVRDRAIPTEKLSILTVKEKIIIDKILVMAPASLSFLEIKKPEPLQWARRRLSQISSSPYAGITQIRSRV